MKYANKATLSIAILVLIIISGYCILSEVLTGKGLPFVYKQSKWSIGIYVGDSPFNLSSPGNDPNPVLTENDITDVPAAFVADPFMVKENDTWYMFFEVANTNTDEGDIGLATSSDGLKWQYQQIVLDERFGLSYPQVFKWRGDYYMIPEMNQANSVRLYKAELFPTKWKLEKVILHGNKYRDPSVFYHNNKWWLFTSTSKKHDDLYLYYANDLSGPWVEHPKNPLIKGNANIARPGGRVVIINNQIIRFTQDCFPGYGTAVRAFRITKLSTLNYEEAEVSESPLLYASGQGWNSAGMHHIDLHNLGPDKWIACVDGRRTAWVFLSKRAKKQLTPVITNMFLPKLGSSYRYILKNGKFIKHA